MRGNTAIPTASRAVFGLLSPLAMADSFPTIALEQLEAVNGGEVDYSQQGNWIDKKMDSYRSNGMGNVQKGSLGQATRNPNLTPNILPFPGK
jgi:hypothetical protein